MLAKRARVFFSVSVVILIVAILLAAWGIPKLVNKKIKEAVTIDNSSQMFNKWIKTPIPLDFKVYLFNVTNAEDVTTGAKPILAEIGPYVYKEYREKTNLTYGANDTVTYMLKKTFEFDAQSSGSLSDEDELTVIYFPYLTALTTVQMMIPSMLETINDALKEFFPNVVDPFMRVKVKDLLFDGVFLDCSGNHSALGLICMQVKAEKNPTMRPAEEGKNGFYFSLFSHMNRTEAGPYEINRGRENVAELGHITAYKGKKSSNSWSDKYCGMLNGTDSTIYPPILDGKPPTRIYNFEPDVCRSMYASYVGTRTLFDLPSYYYEISSSALAAYSAEPENKCFCKRNWSTKHDGCLVMGVMSLYPCQGAPAIISLPHFYLGSEELLDYFEEGISPNRSLHNTYIYLESATSVVLKGVKRLQFNIEMRQMPDILELAEVQSGLFPLLWIEEGAELTPNLIEEIRSSRSLLQIVEGVRWTILLIAIALTIISALFVIHGSSMSVWPRNSNSVSFILQHGDRKHVG